MLIIRWLGWAQTEIFQQHFHSQMTDVLDRGIGPANGQSIATPASHQLR